MGGDETTTATTQPVVGVDTVTSQPLILSITTNKEVVHHRTATVAVKEKNNNSIGTTSKASAQTAWVPTRERIIVFNPGSRELKIGLASQTTPQTVPQVVAIKKAPEVSLGNKSTPAVGSESSVKDREQKKQAMEKLMKYLSDSRKVTACRCCNEL